MRGVLTGILGLLFLVFGAEASQDSLVIHRFDEESGLHTTNIRLLLEDGMGYIWCGSEEGLMRYDGYRFQVMGSQADGAPELHMERILYLYLDREGAVWIASSSKLYRYVHEDRRFRSFPLEATTSEGIIGRDVEGIFETADGMTWIVTDAGANAYIAAKNRFTHYPNTENTSGGIIERFSFVEIDQQIWMCVSGKIYRLDRNTSQFEYIVKASIDPALQKPDHFRAIVRESEHTLLLVNKVALYRYDLRTTRAQRITVFDNISIAAAENAGVVWISCVDGSVVRFPLRGSDSRQVSDVQIYQ